MKMFFLCVLFIYALSGYSQSIEDINKDIDRWYDDVIRYGKVDYTKAQENQEDLEDILKDISVFNLSELSSIEQKVLYINAYNLITIRSVLDEYPVTSVQKIEDFFTKEHLVGGNRLSLDQLENKVETTDDPRLHMLLVCGAESCPPLYPEAFTAEDFEDVLAEHTKKALLSDQIVRLSETGEEIAVNQLFKWNIFEFPDLIGFINEHSDREIPASYRITYQPYNWSLNDVKSVQEVLPNRYFASRLYGKGEFEFSVFNNYYSQLIQGNPDIRTNFFTSFINGYLGLSSNVNIGLELKYRSVTEGSSDITGPWSALNMSNAGFESNGRFSRIGLTAITPKIKYHPFPEVRNITLQHAVAIPLIYSGEGDSDKGYIDWTTPSIYNDFYYDQILIAKASLFIQLGFYLENTGPFIKPSNDGYYQISTPMTIIPSFFLSDRTTLYLLVNAAPRWGVQHSDAGASTSIIPDPYNQYGAGFKYFMTEKVEAELLYTQFFTSTPGQSASTYNLGIRYFGWN